MGAYRLNCEIRQAHERRGYPSKTGSSYTLENALSRGRNRGRRVGARVDLRLAAHNDPELGASFVRKYAGFAHFKDVESGREEPFQLAR